MTEQNDTDRGLEESITIQPLSAGGGAGVMPYPWHVILCDGAIGRQDFWAGNPAQLIGFADEPDTGEVDFLFDDWLAEPERAIGCYPVFAAADGEFSTGDTPIESIHHGHARR